MHKPKFPPPPPPKVINTKLTRLCHPDSNPPPNPPDGPPDDFPDGPPDKPSRPPGSFPGCNTCEPCPCTQWIYDNLFFVVCCGIVVVVIIILIICCIVWWCPSIGNSGLIVTSGRFSFLVRIIFKNKYVCTGVLVARDFVLTLSSCFGKERGKYGVMVGLSKTTLVEKDKSRGKFVSILQIHQYEEWHSNSPIGDIAVIQLSENITFSEMISATYIFPNLTLAYYDDYVFASFHHKQNRVQYKKVTVLPVDKCEQKLGASYGYKNFGQRLLCIAEDEGFRGEKGGALVKKFGGHWTIFGLIGHDFDKFRKPIYFTDVTYYTSWVTSYARYYCLANVNCDYFNTAR